MNSTSSLVLGLIPPPSLIKVFAFAFVLFALVALGPTLPAEAFYGSCSEPGIYFFASPFPNSRSVSIVHALDALQSAGIDVTVAVSHAPQLIVVINATADHVLTADFLPTDAAYSNIQVTIVRLPAKLNFILFFVFYFKMH
jgi:hypothetical protein